MALQSELHALTLADLLAIRSLAELYAIEEGDYPYLQFLSDAARHAIEQNWAPLKRQNLEAAALTLRAIIRVAQTKPYPELLRFLRSITEEHEIAKALEALEHLGGLPVATPPPIVEEAIARLAQREPLADLAWFVAVGVLSLLPFLQFLVSRTPNRPNSEANL